MSRIPKQCKRLAEVDFPIAVVSKHSAKEKSIRHGHPSTLHLWWARRPLAACRAMLMALLLPDPVDPHCPSEFIVEARTILLAHPGASDRLKNEIATGEGLRKSLLKFVGDFANWDVASNPDYLRTSRALVKAAHGDDAPLVVDPFAGGGSIPLEALRIGCDAFASDLNPVACLLLKTMLEDIPRHGPGLADELRKVGAEIKKEAEGELKPFYPDDADGSTPIAYLWARTIRCEAPDCGTDIPLMRSFWLSKKPVRRRALRPIVRQADSRRGGSSDPPTIEFEVFTPKSEKEVRGGTVARAKATCLACGNVLAPERVRSQLYAQRGGADAVFNSKGHRTGGAILLAVVSLHENKTGRQYRAAEDGDYQAVWKAQKRVPRRLSACSQ
jgi:adenine-specific DNA methylase